MIDDCSLGSIRSLILISRLRKVPAGRWATPIPYGLRRRATASEMLAMYGIVCHKLSLATVSAESSEQMSSGELSFEVTEFFFFFGFWRDSTRLNRVLVQLLLRA